MLLPIIASLIAVLFINYCIAHYSQSTTFKFIRKLNWKLMEKEFIRIAENNPVPFFTYPMIVYISLDPVVKKTYIDKGRQVTVENCIIPKLEAFSNNLVSIIKGDKPKRTKQASIEYMRELRKEEHGVTDRESKYIDAFLAKNSQ